VEEAGAPEQGLFDPVLAHGPVFGTTTSPAWLQAMLDAEAALALALADVGAIPVAAAEEVAAHCGATRFDAALIGSRAVDGGNPVIPLVAALRAGVRAEAAEFVHWGATSQDILDTAAVLVAQRSIAMILGDLDEAADIVAELARAHRETPMAGRTLLQQAVPTTFGLVAAGWLTGLDSAADRLRHVRDVRLAAQLGGAAGTLESFGADGEQVVERFAARLGLAVPRAPWHTERSRIAELAGALGGVGGVVGKIATDVVLLAQTEIAELGERAEGRGGSSAMPHKQNPVAAIAARASVAGVPGLVSTLLAAMQHHELQRAAGAWHAEWPVLTALLRAAGSGAAWLHDSLSSLHVDTGRMLHNLEVSGGLIVAERLTTALAAQLGRQRARALVTDACRRADAERRSLAEVLAEESAVTGALTAGELTEVLDPARPAVSAVALVDRILATRSPEKEH
jgi:3-carboxy-cis,cis-muconate cycloisomerase